MWEDEHFSRRSPVSNENVRGVAVSGSGGLENRSGGEREGQAGGRTGLGESKRVRQGALPRLKI